MYDEKKLMESQKFLVVCLQREWRYFGGNLIEGKYIISVKGKFIYISLWEFCFIIENSFFCCSIDVELKNFELYLI